MSLDQGVVSTYTHEKNKILREIEKRHDWAMDKSNLDETNAEKNRKKTKSEKNNGMNQNNLYGEIGDFDDDSDSSSESDDDYSYDRGVTGNDSEYSSASDSDEDRLF